MYVCTYVCTYVCVYVCVLCHKESRKPLRHKYLIVVQSLKSFSDNRKTSKCLVTDISYIQYMLLDRENEKVK